MKVDKLGKDWALVAVFLFWSAYLLTWVTPTYRGLADFFLFMMVVSAGFRWVAEDG